MLERYTGFSKLGIVERLDVDMKEDFCDQGPRYSGVADLLRLCLVVCILNDRSTEARLATNAVRGVLEGKP